MRILRERAAYLVSTLALIFQAGASAAQVDKAQAALHTRIAMIALGKNDMEGAEVELKLALKFDPANPLALLNLAVVQAERSPREALSNLDKAIGFGLPDSEMRKAADLRPRIMYALGRETRSLAGTWKQLIRDDSRGEERITIWAIRSDGLPGGANLSLRGEAVLRIEQRGTFESRFNVFGYCRPGTILEDPYMKRTGTVEVRFDDGTIIEERFVRLQRLWELWFRFVSYGFRVESTLVQSERAGTIVAQPLAGRYAF